MIANRVYYAVKPILPLTVRLFLRRWRATQRRKTYAGVWPIDPNAGATPPAWPGWPEGKRFAFVLTHDVEGNKGLGRIERLMDLESKHGFRSSFNLVPEGEYRVPDSLRQAMDRAGFEVGVHGLEHDGKLYNSKAEFARKAAGINRYLHQWNACGFRSPLMQHRLAWLHQLDIEYDCSTFDTDPFEPEPDGAGTIFPFWVPGPNGSGYVELPYSLVQDFNLFVVLREPDHRYLEEETRLDSRTRRHGLARPPTPITWRSRASRRAMSIRCPTTRSSFATFARSTRAILDGDAARGCPVLLCTPCRLLRATHARKVCMLVYSHYETDSRVRRYAEALARRGDHVDVIALSQRHAVRWGKMSSTESPSTGSSTANRTSGTSGRSRVRQVRFLLTSALFLARRQREMRYDLVHVHNIPDFLVFAAWHAKAAGAKLILDIHDIVPELFASKFGRHEKPLVYQAPESHRKGLGGFRRSRDRLQSPLAREADRPFRAARTSARSS